MASSHSSYFKDRVRKLATGIAKGVDMTETSQCIDCNTCVETKQTKTAATGTLAKGGVKHVVHSDIIGPIDPQTIGGARYILCFIVEPRRYAKVFIIKRRSQLGQCFSEFEAWIERATGTPIERLHSDNAKEYVKLGVYLKQKGIT